MRFAAELDAAIDKIERNPERFASTFAACQYCLLEHYPYSVVYYHTQDRVTVVVVAHAKRRPGYWRSRV